MPIGAENYKPHVCRILDHIKDHFHSAWIPDHFMNRDHDDYPESLVTISHLAALYPQLYFGPVVLGQNYRNPALLAKMAATIQQLTGGRFILGMGAGWHAEEYNAYGYDFPSAPVRIAQLAEAVQICKAMWDPAQPEATFQGRYYHINNAVCNPKPSPAPPVMIGGAGEKLMLRVIAQHADWWNLVGVSPETYAHKIQVLNRHCAGVGRNPAEIRKTWMGVASIAPTRQQAEATLEKYPIWPDDIPIVGTPAEVIAQLRHYTALGVDLFILAFADEPDLTGINLFIEEVMPAVRESQK
jgi:alkanesulfonate monooxygenase SsuD/methylene tetrahydromethanopterin reductase-like flavin-dependent oxidoreductase (luciferase family)